MSTELMHVKLKSIDLAIQSGQSDRRPVLERAKEIHAWLNEKPMSEDAPFLKLSSSPEEQDIEDLRDLSITLLDKCFNKGRKLSDRVEGIVLDALNLINTQQDLIKTSLNRVVVGADNKP